MKLRNILAKLRLSSHNLLIETGRHNNIDRNDRKCTICNNNDIEDEYHFVLICTLYDSLRKQYISNYFTRNPSMFKFLELLNSERKSVLTKLAIYCNKAFKLRFDSLNAG